MQASAAAVRIERAAPAQVGDVLALLAQSGLPIDGLADHWPATLVALQAGGGGGRPALAPYGAAARLRPGAGAKPPRGEGSGRPRPHPRRAPGLSAHRDRAGLFRPVWVPACQPGGGCARGAAVGGIRLCLSTERAGNVVGPLARSGSYRIDLPFT